jgi:hypothetical protein
MKNVKIPTLPPRRRTLLVALSAIALAASAGLAVASTCEGCDATWITPPLPQDPCFVLSYTSTTTDGTCAWDGPNCNAGLQCSIDLYWEVKPKVNPPGGCLSAGVFNYTVIVDGSTTQSGAVASSRQQHFTGSFRCSAEWVLDVHNATNGLFVGAVSYLCNDCEVN